MSETLSYFKTVSLLLWQGHVTWTTTFFNSTPYKSTIQGLHFSFHGQALIYG